MKRQALISLFVVLAGTCAGQTFAHIDGRFRQVRESALFAEPAVETGRFTFDAPDHVLWQYDSGSAADLPAPVLRFISGAVGGSLFTDNDDFAVMQTSDGFILTPKKARMSKWFDRIEVRLDARGIAEEVVMHEPSGDVTHIFFENMQAQTQ